MRHFIKRVIELLDGSPAAQAPSTEPKLQRRQRGQSLVEMAFLTPLLIILFAGLVEIGWLANNYLNLLDITRYGARRGTTLTDTRSPLFWDDRSSYVPNAYLEEQYQMAYSGTTPAEWGVENGLRVTARDEYPDIQGPEPDDIALTTNFCEGRETSNVLGFYNEVACTMIASMTPLELNPYNGVDDIIVSVFSLELIDVTQDNEGTGPDRWTSAALRPIAENVPQLLVVGRYPTNANECQAAEDGSLSTAIFDGRDPFDFNGNTLIDINVVPTGSTIHNENDEFEELEGFDVPDSTSVTYSTDFSGTAITPYTNNRIEKQVGFQWFGNHVIVGTGCIGSEFNIRDIEALFNLQGYVDPTNPNAVDERRVIPSQGVVLVEMYWEHEMLLQIPVLSPVFEAFSQDGRPDLYLWAMFPLPAADPFIEMVNRD
jgi:Flp pilus assembly protein TadG